MTAAPRPATGPLAGPFRWRHLVVGVPLLVWLVTLCLGALLAAWSAANPPYQSPDEANQVDRVLSVAAGDVLPAPLGRHLGVGLVRSGAYAGVFHCCPRTFSFPLAKAPAHPPSYRALGGVRADPAAPYNQLSRHPPLYYLWESAAVKVMPASWPYTSTLLGLRLAGAALLLPLPVLAYAATRRLTGHDGLVAVSAAVLPLGIPGMTALGAAVSNDAGMLLTGGLLAVLLAYVATGDTSRRTGGWLGLVVGLGLLVKAFAFAAFPALALAYLLAWLRTGRGREVLAAGGLAVGAAALVAGWYWVRLVARYGSPVPFSGQRLLPPAPKSFHPHPVYYFLHFYPRQMMINFFGNFGPRVVPLPGAWLALLVAVLLGGIALGCRLRPTRAAPWSWLHVATLVSPAVLIFVAVGLNAYHGYVIRDSLAGTDGRYLYYGMGGLLAAVALGVARVPRVLRRWVPFGLLLGAFAVQAVGLRTVLRYFYGPGSLGHEARAVLAWSAWTGPAAAAVAALGVLAALAALAVAAGHYGRYRPRRASSSARMSADGDASPSLGGRRHASGSATKRAATPGS